MRSTIVIFVIVFAVLGLLLGFSQSYDAPAKSLALGAASKIDIGFYNNSADSLCPDNPRDAAEPDVDWGGCNFLSRDLSGVNLSGATLSSTVLAGSLLMDANLSGADLFNADLTIANLFNAILSSADLSGAKLDCRGHPICKD